MSNLAIYSLVGAILILVLIVGLAVAYIFWPSEGSVLIAPASLVLVAAGAPDGS